MFDLWNKLKYNIKKAFNWHRTGVRRFFCKHHYIEEKEIRRLFGDYGSVSVKCSKCGKVAEKEEWMTIYGKDED